MASRQSLFDEQELLYVKAEAKPAGYLLRIQSFSQLSTIDFQLSTLNSQLSTIDCQSPKLRKSKRWD
ncbi:MAG: hypothetical protein HC786_12875 [Richelia sp. CSU_2_1]|nr:hypothetical protein [Richelia sp. CSU_2_1]